MSHSRTAGAQRSRYHALREAGLCSYCGKEPALAGRARCAAHRELELIRRRAKVANGFCTSCPKVAIKGRTECRRHTRIRLVRQRARRARFVQAGLCALCGGKPMRPGLTLCSVHTIVNRAQAIALRARLKEAGLCIACGGSRVGSPTLQCCSCRERHNRSNRKRAASLRALRPPKPPRKRYDPLETGRALYARRREAGLCVRCSELAAPALSRCRHCLTIAATDQRARTARHAMAGVTRRRS